MASTLLDLATAKLYLRVDWLDEDSIIQIFIDESEQYLRDAIDDFDTKILNVQFANKCRIPMLQITQSLFDDRNYNHIDKDKNKRNDIVTSFIQQLQFKEVV